MVLMRGLMPAAVAAASLLSCAVVNAQGPSIASCSVSGSAFGNSASDDVFVEIVSALELGVCGEGGDRTATELATDTATAIASAVANATADCTASNLGSFIVNGQTLGAAVARSTAEALIDALVVSESCANCTASIEVFSSLFEEIIVNGVSVAETALSGQSQFGTTVSQSADFFIETVVNATVSASAEILSTAVADSGFCQATLDTEASAGSQSSFCSTDLAISFAAESLDGIAEASEAAVAVACGAPGTVPFENQTEIATAIANATVTILRTAFLLCELPTNGVNCFNLQSFGRPVAFATAAAFAQGVANASSLCPDRLCSVSAEIVAEAIDTIVLFVQTGLGFEQCNAPGGFDLVEVSLDFVGSNLVPVVSSIIASAQVAGDECTIFLNTTAEVPDASGGDFIDYTLEEDILIEYTIPPPPPPSAPVIINVTNVAPPTPPAVTIAAPQPVIPPPVTPAPLPPPVTPPPAVTTPTPTTATGVCADPADCVPANRQCAGTGFAASKACCDAGFLCVRRNEGFSQCRLNGEPGLSAWEGTILPCGSV